MAKSKFVYQARDKEDVSERANQKGGMFDSYLRSNVQTFTPKQGDNAIRVCPPTWPKAKHFGFDVWIHNNIGGDRNQYLCPKKMKHGDGKCAVCDAHDELKADGGDEEELKALIPQRRVGMYVVDRDAEKEGPKFWAMSWSMDKDVSTLCVNKKTGAVLFIDDPDDGYDLTFKRDGQGLKTRYNGMAIDRDPSPLAAKAERQDQFLDFLTENPVPELLVYFPYDHVKNIMAGKKTKKADDDDEGGSASRRRIKDSEDEEKPSGRARRRDEEEKPSRRARDEEDEEPPRRRNARDEEEERPSRRARAEEDEEPPPRSRRAKDEAPDEEEIERGRREAVQEPPPRRRAKDEEDEEPPPRRRAAKDEPEDEEPPPRRRAAKEEDEEPPPRRRAAKDEEDEEPPPRRRTSRDEEGGKRLSEDPPARRRPKDEEDEEPPPRRRAAKEEDEEPPPRRRAARDEEDEDPPARSTTAAKDRLSRLRKGQEED